MKEQIARLRSFGPEVTRTADGLLLHLPKRPEIADEVADFTVAEKGCCAFWGFETTTTAEQLALRWEGPPQVADLLDQLVEFFAGDADLDSLDGLL